MFADLHMHTTASDGRLTPSELIAAVLKKGLQVIAITDHDTLAAYEDESITQCIKEDLRLLTGIEISCTFGDRDLHLLGYGFDLANKKLRQVLQKRREERLLRARAIIERLASLGVYISEADIEAAAGKESIGRPHIAEAMVHRGFVRSTDEAFARYLGRHQPAYVRYMRLDLDEAIKLVHDAGGIAILAHPGLYYNEVDDVRPLLDAGVEGLEVFHPAHTAATAAKWQSFARENKLLITGGSDFHGVGSHRGELGSTGLDEAAFTELMEQARSLGRQIQLTFSDA